MTRRKKTLLLPIALLAATPLFGEARTPGSGSHAEVTGEVAPAGGPRTHDVDSGLALKLDAKTISARQNHACALDQGGKAYCWGVNAHGQLGVGDTENRSAPTPVAGDLTFTTISAGAEHTCAVTTDGAAYCWGNNAWGRLGTGDVASRETPVRVATDLRFATISAGVDHTCAITTENKAYCWGRGNFAKLGNGQAGAQYEELLPVPVAASVEFASISTGKEHTCAVAVDGKGYCWGNDGAGRAGLGVGRRVDAVTEIQGGHRYVSINAGTTYSCGLTTDGEIYCFGVNKSGMQGHGKKDGGEPLAQNAPTHPVAGGHKWKFLSASHAHTCGITTDDELYCWGNSRQGRLGIGRASGIVETPAKVSTDKTFAQVTVGWTFSCGITTANEIYCWGNGASGRLGHGATTSQSTPVLVSPIGN